ASLAQRLGHRFPGAPFVLRSARVAISGQIDYAPLRAEVEKIEQPGAARRLAGPREPLPLGDGVDGAGLAGVRPPYERHLSSPVGRKLRGGGGADQELGLWEAAHWERAPGRASCGR